MGRALYLNLSPPLRDKTKKIGWATEMKLATSSTIPGFSLEEQEDPDIREEIETIPPEMYLPEVSSKGFPKTGDVPYVEDFDDSGLSRYLEEQFDNVHFNRPNWTE
jgi:hypothetical protein